MKAPKCICGGRHWSTQPCVTKDRELLRNFANNVTPVTEMLEQPNIGDWEPIVEKPQRGRPRKHESNADRQRAYRERKA